MMLTKIDRFFFTLAFFLPELDRMSGRAGQEGFIS